MVGVAADASVCAGVARASMPSRCRAGTIRCARPRRVDRRQRFAAARPAGRAARSERLGRVQPVNEVAPDRRSAGDAGDVAHRRAGKIADPDADRVARREADAPVVAHVLAGAGLHRAPDARRERVLEAEAGGARAAIGEDVADDEAAPRAEHAMRRAATVPAVERTRRAPLRRRWRAHDTRW